MTSPVFGVVNTRPDTEAVPVLGADFSKVGIITTSDDADAALFPEGELVNFSSNDATYKAGLGTGYLADAINGINDQIGPLGAAVDVTVVRVATGGTSIETMANVVAGIETMKTAPSEVNRTPRIILCPGYTAERPVGVDGLTIATAGSGYVVGDALTASGGGGTGFSGRVSAVDGSGGITAVEILTFGSGYTSAPTIAITTTAGALGSITATTGAVANPVVAELPALLNALLAVAIVDAPDSSRSAAEAWREDHSSERIIPVGVSAKVLEGVNIVTRPMAPRIAGIMVRVDNAHGGKPFHPIANQAVSGILGTNRNIPFSTTDGAVEGQIMLAADVGVVVRGELGVDSAIADGGFVFIGTESCATGDLWSQFHQIRGADYITVKMMRITRQFLGKAINADMVEAWINSIRFMLRDHKAANDILGYDPPGFPKNLNSPEQIRLGRLTVVPKIEPAPVFRVGTHEFRRYRPALDELVATIISRLSATA